MSAYGHMAPKTIRVGMEPRHALGRPPGELVGHLHAVDGAQRRGDLVKREHRLELGLEAELREEGAKPLQPSAELRRPPLQFDRTGNAHAQPHQ
eukprot:scaffold166951_cov27-Tisochrysis_lutea.AAC.2